MQAHLKREYYTNRIFIIGLLAILSVGAAIIVVPYHYALHSNFIAFGMCYFSDTYSFQGALSIFENKLQSTFRNAFCGYL